MVVSFYGFTPLSPEQMAVAPIPGEEASCVRFAPDEQRIAAGREPPAKIFCTAAL